MTVAYGTQVAVGDGEARSMELIEVGDTAWAGGPSLQWGGARVSFSMGAPPSPERPPIMVYVHFGDEEIVATPDHPLLLSDGRLVRSRQLYPRASLMRANGQSALVDFVVAGQFNGGLHDIAVNGADPTGSLDGHLIVTNGIVSGDFALQTHGGWADANLPAIGTRAYEEAYALEPPISPAAAFFER